MRLADRVAIVTGGSRGIGRAYAERFLREGASVVIADVDDANGATTTFELRDRGAVEYVHCDVSDSASAETCVRESLERFGRIDILVNNAALYGDWEMANQSFDYLKRVFDVNLHGVWLMTRAVAPQMVDQEYGRIVNQASAAA
jgi:3-oxoacyl-[acyl-carrier protein] reductase